MSGLIHLLYAEDNPQDADLIRAHFEREAADIQLEIVETGSRCLARLAEYSFDLLLLDNNLPDLDGVDVLNLMRDEAYTLPVVLITGTGDEDVVARALRAGAADYVSKSDENYLVTLPDLLRKQVALYHRHLAEGDGEKLVWDILYVEPNAMDIELTARHVAAEAPHLRLHIASNSRDALALLAAEHHFDLVLTDLRIPDLHAPDFMREVQQLGIELPFIVITGKGDEASAVAVLRLGAYDYIVKRENYLTHLPHAIDNALHRFHLDQTTRRLHAELAALNTSLEQKVGARTAQLRQEMELRRASEASYQHLIETTHELVQSIGADGHFTFVNHAWCVALGWTCEEALQLSFSQIVKPDQLGHCQALFGQLMQGKNFNQVEVAFVAKDGHEIIVEGNLSSIFVDGIFVGTQSFFRDITERKRVEAESRERERQLSTLIDNLPGLVYRCHNDKTYTIEFVSDGIEKMTGYPVDDFRQHHRHYGQLIHPGDQEWVWEEIQAALQKNLPFELSYRFIDASGTEKWAWERGRGIYDNHGQLLSLEGFVTDITERKQAEAQLKLAAKVFEQSREAFIITDADRNIVMVNHAFTVITGYSEAEALGKNPRFLYSGRQDESFYHSMWESINTHGHWQGEVLDRRKDGSVFPKWLSISRVLDEAGEVTHYIGIFGDISQIKQGEEQIQRLAHFDALTGLPNRVLLNDRINLALSTAQRSHLSLAVMFVDLDHFKNVNDTLGHRIGDALLVEVAARLKLVVREEDTVSRLGGDEFILILPGVDAAGAAHIAEKLITAVAQRYQIEQHDLVVTPSIGIAIYPSDGEDFETLSKCADVAMYRAKRDGRNNYRFFTPEMQARSTRTLKLENALHQALQQNQLEIYYQPLIALKDGSTIGAEALLRWKHPEFGLVLPSEFIPIAEDSGQILQIGEWVLRSAAQQLKTWMDDGMTPIVMAVNLSVVQFRKQNLPDMVMHILDEVKLSPQYLELELTEGVAMNDPLGAIAMMDQLHQRGIRMSIDDFGTGYSSLNYLKRFQVGKLKIDQSFVRDITIDPEDKAIVSAIIRLAEALNLQTIAEGVETEGQLAFLREQGCNEAQGYYFSEALPAGQFKAWCGKKRPKLR